MSGTLATRCSTARIASSRYGTSSRFTMKPELSFAATGSLPSDLAKANARRNVSSDVVTVRTTSTSGISGTGLKKCSPTKRSPRCVAAAMAAIVRLDVLDAKIVSEPHSSSSSRHSAFLSSRSSVTASITMSHPFRSAVAAGKASRLRAGPRPGDIEGLPQFLRDPHERARLLARQGVLGPDLAPLEAVEHLLEPYLDPLVLGAVAPRHEEGGDAERRACHEQERRDEGDRHRRAERDRRGR